MKLVSSLGSKEWTGYRSEWRWRRRWRRRRWIERDRVAWRDKNRPTRVPSTPNIFHGRVWFYDGIIRILRSVDLSTSDFLLPFHLPSSPILHRHPTDIPFAPHEEATYTPATLLPDQDRPTMCRKDARS
ncbi:hypothetical protein Hypma_003941 [Hypsizygus marmoreus]|uniref:Uncharacterized protein n=1 Tax=Hypsizygus marmoreus TaxID=39966 RepID=A0A369J146_HYPMA|nr:hypothetical protein Hypma_003941 [Hypsizygus marmoreus]